MSQSVEVSCDLIKELGDMKCCSCINLVPSAIVNAVESICDARIIYVNSVYFAMVTAMSAYLLRGHLP